MAPIYLLSYTQHITLGQNSHFCPKILNPENKVLI